MNLRKDHYRVPLSSSLHATDGQSINIVRTAIGRNATARKAVAPSRILGCGVRGTWAVRTYGESGGRPFDSRSHTVVEQVGRAATV